MGLMRKDKEPPRCPFCERLVSYGTKYVKCTNPHCKFHDGGCDRKAFDTGVVHMFVKFYALYPVKKKPRDSLRAWLKLNPDKKLYKTIMTHVAKSKAHSKQWKDGYVPHPTTYINGFRWEDDIDIPKQTGINMPKSEHVDELGYFRKKPERTPESAKKISDMFEQFRIDQKNKKGENTDAKSG